MWSAIDGVKITDWLSALFSLLLTVFTYQLYVATRGLWKTTLDQQKETKKTIELTKESLKISQDALKATQDSVALSQKTFVVSHPPRIDVIIDQVVFGTDTLNFTPLNKLFGTFLCVNSGDTKAKILSSDASFQITSRILPPLPRYSNHLPRSSPVSEAWLLPGGDLECLVDSGNQGMSERQAQYFNNAEAEREWSLFFKGWIRFEDEAGSIKTKVFCREFNRRSRQFEAVTAPGYERYV